MNMTCLPLSSMPVTYIIYVPVQQKRVISTWKSTGIKTGNKKLGLGFKRSLCNAQAVAWCLNGMFNNIRRT